MCNGTWAVTGRATWQAASLSNKVDCLGATPFGLTDLQQRHGVSFLFISHDLAVISHLCQDLVVMRAGQIVEAGPAAELLRAPREAYTRALLAAVA